MKADSPSSYLIFFNQKYNPENHLNQYNPGQRQKFAGFTYFVSIFFDVTFFPKKISAILSKIGGSSVV